MTDSPMQINEGLQLFLKNFTPTSWATVILSFCNGLPFLEVRAILESTSIHLTLV